jgi:hypothetical protein
MDEFTQNIADIARTAVDHYSPISGGPLDFSEASLEHVEGILASASAQNLSDDDASQLTQLFGCYLLEVGRRCRGGRYSWYEAGNQPVLVAAGPDWRVAMIAFDKVRGRLGGDEGDNIPFFYEGFARRVANASPGTDAFYI